MPKKPAKPSIPKAPAPSPKAAKAKPAPKAPAKALPKPPVAEAPKPAEKAEAKSKKISAAAPPRAAAKAPEPKAAAAPAPKSKFTREELKHFKQQLFELRDRLTRQVGAMEGAALKEGDSEVSVDHMADHGTDTFEQDFTLGLIENEENTIREIDAAIERIEEGSFGLCEPCIEEPAKLCRTCPYIPKARIEAIPYTRYCVEYARIAERDREIEEASEDEEE